MNLHFNKDDDYTDVTNDDNNLTNDDVADLNEFSHNNFVNSDEEDDTKNYTSNSKNYEHYTYPDRFDGKTSSKKGVKNGGSNNGLKNFFIVSIILLIIFIFILIGFGLYFINTTDFLDKNFNFSNILNVQKDKSDSESSTTTNAIPENKPKVKVEDDLDTKDSLTADQVYDKLLPSVVGIVIYDPAATIISESAIQGSGQGSGIIISEDGYIVTNSHVIGDSKTKYKVKVVLHDKEELPATIIGNDIRTDLAVIKIDKTGLSAATFGNSENVRVGESVLALGNPMGLDFAGSLTRGIISAVDRSIGSPQSLVKYIQTDAAINAGNSGGPLIDMKGHIIGINTVKIVVQHAEGLGFAIPSNTVKSVADDIITNGYVAGRAILGITGRMVSNYQAQLYNVPIGVIVAGISKDSSLTNSGIQVGDIITKFNDINITSFDVLYSELSKCTVGQSIKLGVFRPSVNKFSSNTFDVNVTLIEDKGQNQTINNNNS